MAENAIVEPVKAEPGACSQFIYDHRILWLLLFLIVGVTADQFSKQWAQKALARPIELPVFDDHTGEPTSDKMLRYVSQRDIVVIPNIFNLTYKENRAAGFSIASSLPEWFRRPFLISVSSIACLFFLIWYFRLREIDGLLLTALCLVMSGAAGNLLDRARLGYVIDFFDFHTGFLGYPQLHWPTFNVADSLIVAGAIGIIIRTLWPQQPPASKSA